MASNEDQQREIRSYLMPRDPSVDRRCRPRPDMKVRLFDSIYEDQGEMHDTDSLKSENGSSSQFSQSTDSTLETSTLDGALVFLRLRPVDAPSNAYNVSDAGNILVVSRPSEPTAANNKNIMEKHYSFSAIFKSEVKQDEIYERCIRQKIEMEEDFTVLTYGTSGSGKTYTLLGVENQPGIIPRALTNIFTRYANCVYPQPALKLENARTVIIEDDALLKEEHFRERILNSCIDISDEAARFKNIAQKEHDFQMDDVQGVSVFIWISFLEIYNENVFDLLEPMPLNPHISMAAPARKPLKILTNDGSVIVRQLKSVFVKSSEEALRLLQYGLQRVSYASTSVNANSSRSHCIFYVNVLKYYTNGDITQTSYKFCDLAGSERVIKTGNVGSRLKEAQRINTSLMVLGRCLDAASKKKNDIIPIRESKLTMLLQSALMGKEKLAMIVNVTPTEKYYEENMNVLGFAAIAKDILFKQPAIKHIRSRFSFLLENDVNAAREKYIQELLQENAFLRNENDRVLAEMEQLKSKHALELFQQEHQLRNKLVDEFQEMKAEINQTFEARLKMEIAKTQLEYEAKMRYRNQIEDLRDEIDELNDELENYRALNGKTGTAIKVKPRNQDESIINSDDSSDDIYIVDSSAIGKPETCEEINESCKTDDSGTNYKNENNNDEMPPFRIERVESIQCAKNEFEKENLDLNALVEPKKGTSASGEQLNHSLKVQLKREEEGVDADDDLAAKRRKTAF